MNNIRRSYTFISLKKYIFFVTFICFIPHIVTEPLWLFIIFLATISYGIIADYFNYPPPSRWMRFFLVIGGLLLLNGDIHSSEFLIHFLLIFIMLKFLEINSTRDLKVLVLCNFFLIFSALIVIQELWMIIYLLIATLANLSFLLKLSAPEATLRQITSNSSKQLILVIPLSIILFYVFPRIDPLWRVPSLTKSGSTGFSETMSFGSIAEVFNDDSLVMQINFRKKFIIDGYWQGVILSYFTGESWKPSSYNDFNFVSLQELKTNQMADYEILLEPTQMKWLFYTGYPIAGRSSLLFSPDHGLIKQNKQAITQHFVYSLKVQSAPYHVLNPTEYREATQLPNKINPRLNAWAKLQFAKTNNNIQAFITFLHNYIYHEPFWYTLTPSTLNSNSNQLDNFWFDTQKGFCEHYASAITFILRSVNIPARILVGYHGGQWNPIARTILIQQNNAHAWLEYWQEGIGWQQLDPTAFIAPERIDQTIRNRQIDLLNQTDYFDVSILPWGKTIKFYLQSVRFFSEKWFLYYNQNSQQNLLQNIGLGKLKKGQLLQTSMGVMILFFIILGLSYQWRQKRTEDFLLLEYHLLQKEFQKFNIPIYPSATLKQQCRSLINTAPELASILSSFIYRYEQLRLRQSKKNKKETIELFKALRSALRKFRFLDK